MTRKEVERLGNEVKRVSELWKQGKVSWTEYENAYKAWEEADKQLRKEKGWL